MSDNTFELDDNTINAYDEEFSRIQPLLDDLTAIEDIAVFNALIACAIDSWASSHGLEPLDMVDFIRDMMHELNSIQKDD